MINSSTEALLKKGTEQVLKLYLRAMSASRSGVLGYWHASNDAQWTPNYLVPHCSFRPMKTKSTSNTEKEYQGVGGS